MKKENFPQLLQLILQSNGLNEKHSLFLIQDVNGLSLHEKGSLVMEENNLTLLLGEDLASYANDEDLGQLV